MRAELWLGDEGHPRALMLPGCLSDVWKFLLAHSGPDGRGAKEEKQPGCDGVFGHLLHLCLFVWEVLLPTKLLG